MRMERAGCIDDSELRKVYEQFAEMKALSLLYAFHALRFPFGASHHQVVLGISGFEGTSMPEELLTFPSVPVRDKVQYISQQYKLLIQTLEGLGAKNPTQYETVVEWCNTARQKFSTGLDLTNDKEQPLTTENILPEPWVMDAMVRDFIDREHPRVSHCQELEWFIGQISLQQAS